MLALFFGYFHSRELCKKLSEKNKRKQIKEIFGERAREFYISMSDDIPILSYKECRLQFVYVPGEEFASCFSLYCDTLFPFSDELLEKNELEKHMTQDFMIY